MDQKNVNSQMQKLGITVVGLVMGNNNYTVNDKIRLSVDLAVTGCKEMISVPVESPLPVGSIHTASVAPSLFKGRLYWNLNESV